MWRVWPQVRKCSAGPRTGSRLRVRGTEISDAENLNGTLGTTSAGDDVNFSLANTCGFFSVVTDTLNAGRYEFTLNTDESRFVIQNQGVPEPAPLALVGLGMLAWDLLPAVASSPEHPC